MFAVGVSFSVCDSDPFCSFNTPADTVFACSGAVSVCVRMHLPECVFSVKEKNVL